MDQAAWIVFFLVAALTAGVVLVVVMLRLPVLLLAVLPVIAVMVWFLRSPISGFYVLVGATLVIPVNPLGFSDSITDGIPFFLNLSDPTSLNLNGFGITPAEILLIVVFVGVIGAAVVQRETLPSGRLMTPYLIFGAAVLIGEFYGLVRGGDFKLSLWELRPQVYGLAVFILGTQLIKNRSQIKVLLAILIVAEIFKGGVGIVRYFITLSRQLGAVEAIQAHEESYLLGLFLVVAVIGLIWFKKPLVALLVIAAPLIFTAIVVNHRRAGMGALAIELVTVYAAAYMLEPRLRRGLAFAGGAAAVAGVIVVITFWNQDYGAIAEIIRPVKSLIVPSARDLSSDVYRLAESSNLKATFRSSPLIGVGFGHPYDIFYPQSGVSNIDPLWNVIPHNTLLWIPMRMGIIGLIAFWGLISMAIIEAIWAVRTVGDTFVRAVTIFAMAGVLGLLFTAYVDVALENYRNMIVMGLLLALIGRAPYIARPAVSPSPQAGD